MNINNTHEEQINNERKTQLIKELVKINAINLSGVLHKDSTILPIYIDLRLLISYPLLMLEFAKEWNKLIGNVSFDEICGVPIAAIPWATTLSIVGQYPMLLLRKKPKTYGTKKYIEGVYKNGDICVLVDDVIATGESLVEAIGVLQEHGLVVNNIFVIVDREQGGMEQVRKTGCTIQAILTMSEILDILLKERIITQSKFEEIKKFCEKSRNKNNRNS